MVFWYLVFFVDANILVFWYFGIWYFRVDANILVFGILVFGIFGRCQYQTVLVFGISTKYQLICPTRCSV